jgi:hypothetical protein
MKKIQAKRIQESTEEWENAYCNTFTPAKNSGIRG